MKRLALSSMVLLAACAGRPPADAPSVDPAASLSCSSRADCAVLGAVGVVSALTSMEKHPSFQPDRRESSIVLKCQMKRRDSDLLFACGAVSVVSQRRGSPARENLRFRGGMFALPAAKDAEYDLELSTTACPVPEPIRGAKAGEVWTVTLEIPCAQLPGSAR